MFFCLMFLKMSPLNGYDTSLVLLVMIISLSLVHKVMINPD